MMQHYMVFSGKYYCGRLAVSPFGHIYMNVSGDIISSAYAIPLVQSIPYLRLRRVAIHNRD